MTIVSTIGLIVFEIIVWSATRLHRHLYCIEAL